MTLYNNTQEVVNETKPCTSEIPKFRVVNCKYEGIMDAEEEEEGEDHPDRPCVNPASIIPKFEFRGDKNENAYLQIENKILFPNVRNTTN